MCFKNLEWNLERESPKKTMSANGEFGLLQMISEPNTGRCVGEDDVP